MNAEFEEYWNAVEQQGVHDRELVESSLYEAQRMLSPQGMDNYLQGIRAMCTLGRGQDLVLSYIQETPVVVREVGEDVIPDIVESIMKMSSLTSGSVLALVLANLPRAASRLGDAELLAGYLALLHRLTGTVPRGLRPMLENLEELMSRLTLGGLRRWALWGAQTYPRDMEGQVAYFSLNNESSRSILQRERRGTLLVDNQRRLNSYLRALWGRAFFLRPTSGDFETREGLKPFIADYQVFLPDAFDDQGGIKGIEVYRAAAAHAAAHLVYTRQEFRPGCLSETQIRCIELFEDARIEFLACREFPGLHRLWLEFFEQAQQLQQQHEVIGLMLGVTRAIMDPGYRDSNTSIDQVGQAYRQALQADATRSKVAVDAGLEFHELAQQAFGMPTARILETLPIPYRDDNRYFRDYNESLSPAGEFEIYPWMQPTQRKHVSLMEMVNEIDSELEDGNPQEIWVLPTELFPYEDEGVSYNDMEGVEAVSEPCHYPEWDFQVQAERPDWATVTERRQAKADPKLMEGIFEKHKPVANRIRHIIDSLQPQGVVRRRGYEDGDEIDIDAAVRAMIDIRRGIMPDPRIGIRITRHLRDLSMVLLMDLSESTNDRVGELNEGDEGYLEQPTVLELTREACGLLAWAVDSIGDNFAVHGFASDGRHDVQYYRFKDFSESYDDNVRARMAGMRGGLSTRMGAALRHAGRQLVQQPASKRLVLLLTDGEPADIDERDPRYLREDCRHAVDELSAQGVHSFCLTLDANADDYVARIFGQNNYSIVNDVSTLPERLPKVFSTLTT